MCLPSLFGLYLCAPWGTNIFGSVRVTRCMSVSYKPTDPTSNTAFIHLEILVVTRFSHHLPQRKNVPYAPYT